MPISPHETPGIVLIEEHYERIGLNRGWNAARVQRLADLMECTIYELGALVLMKPCEVSKLMRQDRFPLTTSLHFAIIESWVLEVKTGRQQKPVMPVGILAGQID